MQTNREVAEMIAKMRTHPGGSWEDLANDIETILNSRAPGWKEPEARRTLTVRMSGELIARIDAECRRRKTRSREAVIRAMLDEALRDDGSSVCVSISSLGPVDLTRAVALINGEEADGR